MSYEISPLIKEKAPLILAEIKKANSILLHCHPSPDPDSVCSALAMKFAVEQLGKKATIIRGDSEIPEAFMHFPGAKEIMMKNYWEIDPSQYDLFIIVDSAITGVSRIKEVSLPSTMKVINIDHHRTNTGSGSINIVDPTYPATGQLLFDVLGEMKIKITPEIAINLFAGIITDTGGFKFESTTANTFEVAAQLVKIVPDFGKYIAEMENSNTLSDMMFHGLALSSIETFSNGKLAISAVPYYLIEEKKILSVSTSAGTISSILRTVAQFEIMVACIETKPNQIRLSFRTRDAQKYDVSKIAALFGGGGHIVASGATLNMTLDEAKKLVVAKVKELYNL